MTYVFDELRLERQRQEAKFPQQHLPNTQGPFPRFIARADQARRWVDKSADHGSLSWADVLIEEVAEAIDEAELAVGPGTDVDRQLRAELVQVAAVAVRWIEDIDRRTQ